MATESPPTCTATPRDYGRLGLIGILTPQANPTVEPELATLLPYGVNMQVNRLVSDGDSRQRLINYLRRLESTLAGYDTLKLNAVGFACTASSYLVEPDEESALVASLEKAFGYPLVTAAAAIHQALEFLGARRIALACPYPAWLLQHAADYGRAQGFELATQFSAQPDMGDTRAIYQVRAADAIAKMEQALEGVRADAIVITGTGMPALQAIITLTEHFGVPVFNSNLALAWACLRAADIPLGELSPSASFPLLDGWQPRLRLL